MPTIDGREVKVERQEVTPPSWSTAYPGLGMPRPDEPSRRSNMIVKVNIQYPGQVLSAEQKQALQTTFGERRESGGTRGGHTPQSSSYNISPK